MTQSLTKKYASILANDDSAKLMAALPPGFDPREYSLQGDLLHARCAMYGAIECLMAILESRPDLAPAILATPDSAGERVIDWSSAWATSAHVKRLRELAPSESESVSAHGHWPLLRSLSAARWDSAMEWLDAAPAAAKMMSSKFARSPLFLAAEPSPFFLARSPAADWTPPPKALVDALLLHGASPSDTLTKGSTPLGRAAAAGNIPLFEALATKVAAELHAASTPADKALAVDALMRGEGVFSPAHEAIIRDDDAMLSRLIGLGWPVDELTEKKFLPIHLAIRHGSRRCAALLFASKSPCESAESPTSCGSSALASDDPIFWLDFLKANGALLDRRDDHGAHFAELAWERLSFPQARDLWASLGSAAPLRAENSFFGPLERAARSDIDPQAKITHLLAQGFLPARIAPRESHGWATGLSEKLSAIPSNRISGTSFGVFRSLDLGAAWFTGRDPALALAPAPLVDDSGLGGLVNSAFLQSRDSKDEPHPRPSLLSYCASKSKLESLRALISWDRSARHWADIDYLCAWRDAIKSDAPLSVLRVISASLAERSIQPWDKEESCLALANLGPSKRAELGAPVFSDVRSMDALIREASPRALLDLFFLGRASSHRSFHPSIAASSSFDAPWFLAASSPHLGVFKSLAAEHRGPWGAITAFHCALAAASAKRASAVLWLASILPLRAAQAPAGSPWALAPSEAALSLWQEQLDWEVRKAHSTKGFLLDSEHAAEGNASSLLLCALLKAGDGNMECMAAATALLSKGLPAPQNFTALGTAIAEKADAATAIGAPELSLQALRTFCQALCARPDFAAILNTSLESPILAGCPDPAIFDAFLSAGATLGSGAKSSISLLCSRHASRLTPAFAGRLAELDRTVSPASPLGVASRLAAMRPHQSRDFFDISATPASLSRVSRSVKGVGIDGWLASLRAGCCPIAAALSARNVTMAIDLAGQAPDGYVPAARASWMGLWLGARSEQLSRALRPMSMDTAHSAQALIGLEAELRGLQALGAGLNQDPAAEGAALLSTFARDRSEGSVLLLSWLLARGEHPKWLVSLDPEDISYAFDRRLREVFPKEPSDAPAVAPIICVCFSTANSRVPTEDVLALCRAWQAAKLPSTVVCGESSTSIFSFLPPTVFAAHEAEELARLTPAEPALKKSARL